MSIVSSSVVDDFSVPVPSSEGCVVVTANNRNRRLYFSSFGTNDTKNSFGRRKSSRIGSWCLLIAITCSASPRVCHGFIPFGQLQKHKCRDTVVSRSLQVVETEATPAAMTTKKERNEMLPFEFDTGLFSTDVSCSAENNNSGNDKGDDEAVKAEKETSSLCEEEGEVESYAGKEKSSGSIDDSANRRLATVAKAAALAERRRRKSDTLTKSGAWKSTSVGPRRMGSATKARSGLRSTDKLMDAIRKGSSANTAGDNVTPDGEIPDSSLPTETPQSSFFGSVNKSSIHAAVAEMLDPSGSLGLRSISKDGFSEKPNVFLSTPDPGSILIPALNDGDRRKAFGKRAASDRLTVRVATRFDDFDIANLRLSVFSNFTPAVRKTFCSKSCQLLASRRSRGATCIVATVPRYGAILSPRQDIILGSAECSFHEFHGTTLGHRRLQNSILYVTEVAVSPTARRQGIGMKMMQVCAVAFLPCMLVGVYCFCSHKCNGVLSLLKAIDELASIRGVESVYLHVDVSNDRAISLYERNGYEIIRSVNPMYHEFTKSLNLHDGATQGRNHFLLHKHFCPPTWLEPETQKNEIQTETSIGFEILA